MPRGATVPSTFRLTTTARAHLLALAERRGISMSAVLEVLIRAAADDDTTLFAPQERREHHDPTPAAPQER